MDFLRNFLKLGLELGKVAIPAIATVEQAVKQLKAGTEKKNSVLEIIKSSPVIYEMITNKEILDEKLFAEGLSQVNDGYVKIMNSLRKPEVVTK